MTILIILSISILVGILYYFVVFKGKRDSASQTSTIVNPCKTFTFILNSTSSSRVVYENCDGHLTVVELTEELSVCGKSVLIVGPNINVKELPFCAI